MENLSIRLDLLKVAGAFLTKLQGKSATKRCLCIPIDDNPALFLGEKGCYLDLLAYATENNQYGDTHLLKVSLPKTVREKMTDEERRAQPIVGNVRPFVPPTPVQMSVTGTAVAAPDDDNDGLPF